MDRGSNPGPASTYRKRYDVTFIHTWRAPYYEKLVANATKKFTDLVLSGEMIDAAIKSGRMLARETSGSSKKPIAKRRKERLMP